MDGVTGGSTALSLNAQYRVAVAAALYGAASRTRWICSATLSTDVLGVALESPDVSCLWFIVLF